MIWTRIFIALACALAYATGLDIPGSQNALSRHFANLHATAAHTRRATSMPAAAAAPVLHLNLSLYSDAKEASLSSYEVAFQALLHHETIVAAAAGADARVPHALCGPQRKASAARAAIAKYTNSANRVPVLFASRSDDVACWGARLSLVNATALQDAIVFFHVAPVPAAAKLTPYLVQLSHMRDFLTPAAGVFSDTQSRRGLDGLTAVLYRGSNNSSAMLEEWSRQKFGIATESARNVHFGSMMIDGHSRPWAAVRSAVASMDCSEHVLAEGALHSRRAVRVSLERQGTNSSAQDNCALMVLAFLSTQPEVESVGLDPIHQSLSVVTDQPLPPVFGKREELDAFARKLLTNNAENLLVPKGTSSADESQPRKLNDIAKTALLSGITGSAPLWAIGVNGTGQIVQVSDTGFDDASCFFRDYGSAASLTGAFNSVYQVTRSLWNSPVTDKTKRKVVQYISVSLGGTYEYDYSSGHGTHCAGTVAGSVASSDTDAELGQRADYYSNCADYIANCDTWFCSTCGSYADRCDTTCGFENTDSASQYQGMSPGAKIMAYDFGDGSGNLDVPSNIEQLYSVARDAGSFISSNSWGGGVYYYSYLIDLDELLYDYDDFLVLAAAGNAGYDSGDASVLAPGLSKNTLCVGAAETDEEPSTVAYFSSRGPTMDMRIKPDVIGPGDPIDSASASGSAGLATCATATMSGTSMATPAVAGVSALVRQFLVEGRHKVYSPSAFAASRYNMSRPSSALLKAVLVGSTFPLTYGYKSGTYSNPVTLSDFYGATSAVADSTAYALGSTRLDFTQGFGHVRTSNVFDVTGGLDTFLYEDELSEYSTWIMSYEVTNTSTDVTVTLVWNDPPGSLSCGYTDGGYSSTCLVHDLDLTLFQSGKQMYSNFGAATTGSYSSQYDTVNNVEKITLEADSLIQGEIIDVEVVTNGLSYANKQKFAVVITGNLKSSTPSPTVTPPSSMNPTSLPEPAPTQLPIPSPTSLPEPAPTQLPIPSPTSVPVPAPTQLPIPSPASVPVPVPSLLPAPEPTNMPSAALSSRLVPAPTPVPFLASTPQPIPLPTELPNLPPSTPILPVPTPNSQPAPTSFPFPMPTELPKPSPSNPPHPAPTNIPQPAPTIKPIPSPTPLPLPVRTELPVPAPSAIPLPLPSFVPLPVPSIIPSPRPSYDPSSNPTHVPRPAPSPQPSLSPTVADTVSAAVSMSMTTSVASLTSSQENALRSTIARTLGLDTKNIKDFVVTVSRRRRNLLTSYTMATTFTVVTELSKTTSSSAADFSSTIATNLADNIATNIAQDTSLASSISGVDTSTISVVPATRRPSMVPTSAPTLKPPFVHAVESTEDTKSTANFNAAFIGGIAGAVFLIPALLYLYRMTMARHAKSAEVNKALPEKKRVNPMTELMPLPTSSLDRNPAPSQEGFYSQGGQLRECTL